MRLRIFVVAFAVFLAATALVSTIAPGLTLYKSENSSNGVINLMGTSLDDYHKSHGSNVPFTTVLVSITGVDPTKRVTNATISTTFLDEAAGGRLPLVDSTKNSLIDPKTQKIKPQFAELEAQLYLAPFSGEDRWIPYKLSTIIDSPSGFERQPVSIDIPVRGSPQSFPNDDYVFHFFAMMGLPDGIQLVTGDKSSPTYQSFMPTIVGVAPDDRLANWKLTADPVVMRSPLPGEFPWGEFSFGTSFDVAIKRPVSYWTFIYAVSLIPVLLALSFLVRWRERSSNQSEGTVQSLELGAALIALIALRQVFVPSDIVGLTWLDRLLGIELLLICCLVAIVGLYRPHRSDNDKAATEHPA